MFKGLANTFSKWGYGKSVEDLVKELALTNQWLNEKNKKVVDLGHELEWAHNRIDALIYKKEQKERAITEKNTEIAKLRIKVSQLSRELREATDASREQDGKALVRIGKLYDIIHEYRRQIKCLHEQVRKRNMKIARLMDTTSIGSLIKNQIELKNQNGALKLQLWHLGRKFKDAKDFIANSLDKNPLKK